MGSTAWKGDALYSGYHTYIAGKEVELDGKISASQLPIIVGTSKDPEVDCEVPFEQNLFLASASKFATSALSPEPKKTTSVTTFVTPTSFYGMPAKPKPKGPLCVIAHDSRPDAC
jgi:DNA repair and recombination protein RAD54B